MTRALSGIPTAPALVWQGRVTTYAELAAAVDRWPRSDVHDASRLSVPDALTCVVAAARRGESVIVVDPDRPPPIETNPGSIPAGLHVSTSGSSGAPRALRRTYRSWTDSFPAFTAVTELTSADRVLVTGPLHATMHLFGALHTLSVGACVTDDPSLATAVHAVPAVLRRLLRAAPRMRTAVVAGTFLDTAVARLAAERGVRVVEYYGSAELSLVATRVVGESAALRTFPGVETDVRDGVLWARSPFMASGQRLDESGWFSAGDLGRVDGDAVVVTGRADAAINVGGTTVIAEDLESRLCEVDGIRSVAVIGEHHSVLGEVVTAVVVVEPGSDLTAIKAAARATVGAESFPRRWIVRDELPRTANGKIARAEIKRSVQ
ncbi:class I adenylate-forming enzyme family protein [Actinomycetes bacterium M1A6_2h]